jgi:hypothetical protein
MTRWELATNRFTNDYKRLNTATHGGGIFDFLIFLTFFRQDCASHSGAEGFLEGRNAAIVLMARRDD